MTDNALYVLNALKMKAWPLRILLTLGLTLAPYNLSELKRGDDPKAQHLSYGTQL